MEYVEAHPEKPWNWTLLSSNPNLTMKYVETHPKKPWNWYYVSENPNVTMEYVETHPEKPWNWEGISRNKFRLDPSLGYVKRRKERVTIAKFNKILRLTRTVTRTVTRKCVVTGQQRYLVRFLVYHTIVESICNVDPVQISKNLLYFTKNKLEKN
jgi:hypothetical protein